MNVPELSVGELRFEDLVEPLGLGVPAPRLSWITTAERPGWHQAAYRIEVDRAGRSEETGWVRSDESVLVGWPFATLRSRERARVRVQVRGADGIESDWSEAADVEIGLVEADQWQAAMITPEGEEDTTAPQPAPLLRHGFELQGTPASARLYVSAYGLYEIELNGQRVGDHVLAPGWTSYHHRLRYATYDVTELLQPGPNAAGAMLADGWYRGNLGFSGGIRNLYGDRLGLLFQLEVTYADGTTRLVCSDPTWRAAEGPIRLSDLYDGETYDARREQDGWSSPGFDDAGWHGVRPLAFDPATLVAPTAPPMRRIELVAPQTITRSPSGRTIVDFGQNLVGRLRITVRGDGGEEVTLRHAEVLEDGELCTRILRKAKATDRYVLRGGGAETWEPRFTFHGFRYAEITGWPADLQTSDVQAVVCHSDLERRGWFTCSEALLERLHDNVVWSVRGNTLDVPTDCPQRDERLGWTGDIQVFAPAATFLSDVGGFLVSWLADLAVEQEALQGVVPVVVPNVMGDSVPAAAAWGDAAVVVPWVLYERTGDRGVLESQFDSMCAWVDAVAERAGDRHLWEHGFQFGDWLDPAAPPDRSAAARTDPYLVATAYHARSADLLRRTAQLLGRDEAATRYGRLATAVREAFLAEYATPAGRLVSDAPTAYALALCFDLFPDAARRRHAGDRLAELVRQNGYRIATGFVGTPLVCDALCRTGHERVAYRLLLQRECPSWLYPVTMGATTIWERWDSMRPDGSINVSSMTSFNHYALGAVADWLHRTVAGLAPDAPGYRRLRIEPRPGGDLTHASARHRTPYGMAEAGWQLVGEELTIEALVPANTTATVVLPAGDPVPFEVGSGRHRWTVQYQPPAERELLPLDSPSGEILDDAQT